jgi:hypothetical protein
VDWTPTERQVLDFEGLLPAFLDEHRLTIEVPLEDYRRQYDGIFSDGKRVLLVQFFHETTNDVTSGDWLRHRVAYAGGGVCYMRGWFDPDVKRIVDFSVNAPL